MESADWRGTVESDGPIVEDLYRRLIKQVAGPALDRVSATASLITIVLFLPSISTSGERIGRLAERLENTEKANEVQRRMLEAVSLCPLDRNELVGQQRDGGF